MATKAHQRIDALTLVGKKLSKVVVDLDDVKHRLDALGEDDLTWSIDLVLSALEDVRKGASQALADVPQRNTNAEKKLATKVRASGRKQAAENTLEAWAGIIEKSREQA